MNLPKKGITFIAVTIFIFSLVTVATSQMTRETKDDLYSQIELFSYALTTVQSEYSDEPLPKDLIYGSLKGMLSSLDPHSQFLTPDDYTDLKTETRGKFGGLGIEISIRDGLLTIISPLEGTPAWDVGLKAGDRIVKIEDDLTRDITLSEAVKKLRGKPGTSVTITVLREDEFKIHEFTIKRAIIKIQDIKDAMILKDKVGYVRLVEFREESHRELRKELQKLKNMEADSLILDLRNNPGGLLNVAIKVAEEFLSKGELIVSTKGRRPSQTTKAISNNTADLYRDWPIVVLINEGSASGSEIVAGALKDNGRAIIVGAKSFGKGSVQSVIPLPDGSGLRLTTSKYYTPSGISIHGTGIEPDIIVKWIPPPKKDKSEKEENVEKIFEDLEKEVTDEKKVKDEEKEDEETPDEKEQKARERLENDSQVQSAITIIKAIRFQKIFNEKQS